MNNLKRYNTLLSENPPKEVLQNTLRELKTLKGSITSKGIYHLSREYLKTLLWDLKYHLGEIIHPSEFDTLEGDLTPQRYSIFLGGECIAWADIESLREDNNLKVYMTPKSELDPLEGNYTRVIWLVGGYLAKESITLGVLDNTLGRYLRDIDTLEGNIAEVDKLTLEVEYRLGELGSEGGFIPQGKIFFVESGFGKKNEKKYEKE